MGGRNKCIVAKINSIFGIVAGRFLGVKRCLSPREATRAKLMDPPRLINGTLHSPFFIFVRCAGQYDDLDLLGQLGLNGYSRAVKVPGRDDKSCVYITSDAQWMHIGDNYFYALWHMPELKQQIKDLATKHDIFTCSVGDCDDSFNFAYYRDGQLVRKYVVSDPHWNGGEVTEDFGPPLPGEEEAMQQKDPLETILSIARSVGIDTRHTPEAVRIYTKSSGLAC